MDILGNSNGFQQATVDATSKMSKFESVLEGIGQGIGQAAFGLIENAVRKVTAAIPSAITGAENFATQVDRIQKSTGASAVAASHFVGQLEYLGSNVDTVASKMGQLAKNIETHGADLAKLGVTIKDTNGNYLDSITIVNNVRDAVSKMTDGVAKSAYEVMFFGKAGAEMTAWLDLTPQQVDLLNGKLDALGVTMSQAMVDNAKAAIHEGDLLNLAMQGLGNTLLTDVGPALVTAIDTITNFVQADGQQIANFAGEVINYVLGMIDALTGANVSASPFTAQIAALTGTTSAFNSTLKTNIDAAITSTKGTKAQVAAFNELESAVLTTTTGTKAHTAALAKLNDALQAQGVAHKAAAGGAGGQAAANTALTASIDKQIAAIKALDTAQQKTFDDAMIGINAQLTGQLNLLSATEKAHSIAEQQASLATQMADAQATLASAQAGTPGAAGAASVVDPKAVETAADAVAAIVQSQADLQQSIADDARRTQIAAVQTYLTSIDTLEKSSTDKKTTLAKLGGDAVTLQSGIAKAKLAGDLQTVSDLTLELQAVDLAQTRVTEAAKNAVKTDSLTKDKANLAALKSATAAAMTGPGGVMPLIVDTQKPITDVFHKIGTAGWNDMGHVKDAVTGQSGLIAAMADAGAAGKAMGDKIKAAVLSMTGALSTAVDLISQVDDLTSSLDRGKLGLGMIAMGIVRGNLALVLAGVAMEGTALGQALASGVGGAGGAPGLQVRGGRGQGNDVPQGTPYTMVPGTGPFSGQQVPSTSVNGGHTFNLGPINITGANAPDLSNAFLLELKRRLTAQGMSLN